MLNRPVFMCAALLAAGVLSMLTASAQAAQQIFSQALVQDRPSSKLGEAAHVYDWLIGDWDMVITDILDDGKTQTHTGEWHFAWVLDGLAVQDVLISPRRGERVGGVGSNRFGTSIRVFDSQLNGWRVTWINPQTGGRNELIGRRVGGEIVQVGALSDGRPIRWTFTDIKPNSATWKGESLADDGQTWRLEAEFKMRRADPVHRTGPAWSCRKPRRPRELARPTEAAVRHRRPRASPDICRSSSRPRHSRGGSAVVRHARHRDRSGNI